jgi:hypothetical protein
LTDAAHQITLIPMKLFVLLALVLVALPVQAQDTPFRELFESRNGRTLAVLKAEFPQDYNGLMIRIGAVERSQQSEMLKLSAAFAAVGEVRRKYVARLRYAPPQNLAALLESAAAFHQAVLEKDGPGACGVFAQNGTGALFSLARSEAYAAEIDMQSARYFEAVAGAIERPEYYGEPQQEDFAVVLAALVAAKVPESYVPAIVRGQRSDPDFCPALVALFRTAAIIDSPPGLRARADLAANLVGY